MSAYPEIDSEPIAAASLGQVYRARMATGEEVAVKVQRPNLEATIAFDIAILLSSSEAHEPVLSESE